MRRWLSAATIASDFDVFIKSTYNTESVYRMISEVTRSVKPTTAWFVHALVTFQRILTFFALALGIDHAPTSFCVQNGPR